MRLNKWFLIGWSGGLLMLTFLCFPVKSELTSISEISTGNDPFGMALEFSPEELSLLEILGSLVGLSSGDITAILSLTKTGLGVIEILTKIFENVFPDTDISSLSMKTNPGADRQLLSMFEIITLRLEQMQRGIEGTEVSLLSLAKGLPHMVRYEIALNTLENYMKPINNLYHRFSYYQKYKVEVEDHTLLDFAESVVSHDTTSIQALMANIHSMIAPSDPPIIRKTKNYEREEYDVYNRVTNEITVNLKRYLEKHPNKRKEAKKLQELSLRPSVFVLLEEAIKSLDKCRYQQSPQQLVFGLYTLLSITLARGYAMINFSYNMLKYHEKGNFTVEKKFADDLYQHYSKGLMRNGLDSLGRVSNTYTRCDPEKHVENETYVMITELLQGYIENEVDLNSKGTCGSKCSSYKHAKVEGCYLPDKQYCGKHRRCKGQVHNCKFFHADANVCISDEPYRRYDWIKYENKKELGRKGSCRNEMKVDSWWRFLYHCSYCMCLCDDPMSPTSDRFVSLRPVVSDIAAGKVVTGIRFVKKNRVLQIQVQQGKAMPQGQVNPDTLEWVETEEISVGTQKFVNNVDYFTLKYEARDIDLDKLKAPKGHVVTGVRFRTLGTHLNLEIWVTPINFINGTLSPKLSYWISNDNTPVMAMNPRQRVKLYDPDDPRRSNSMAVISSQSDTFIKLQPSSMVMDVSQLTVPFFDAQPVAPSPSTWLEGIQLYHRGRSGYGGFIGFKVFNFNLTRYFNNEDYLETLTP